MPSDSVTRLRAWWREHRLSSVLKFIEERWGLAAMGASDKRADDLLDCFNFSQQPRPFTAIAAPYSSAYFLQQGPSYQAPDDD